MKKILLVFLLSLNLLSFGEILISKANAEITNKKTKKDALNNKLISSIQNKNIKQVKELISKGANVNYVVSDGIYKGFTPLIFDSQRSNNDLVQLLISKGANVNISI